MTVTGGDSEQYRQFEHAVNIIGDCTDDYLYFMDLGNDYFSISESVMGKYPFPAAKFNNAIRVLRKIVYKKDFANLFECFRKVLHGIEDSVSFDCRWIDKEGKICWINCRGKVIKGTDDATTHIVGRITELGERKKADNVTGFRTHILFERDYANHIENKNFHHGFVMRIGIDNFREINEKYGMERGDDVLRSFSKCLANVIPSNVRIYRMEGDEFSVFFSDSNYSDNIITEIFECIQKEIEKSRLELEYKIFYTVSAGVVRFPADVLSYDEMYKKSEFALSRAKKSGKNSLSFFSHKLYEEQMRELDVQEELRKSVKNNFEGFYLTYQPIMNAEKSEIAGAEALLRWNCGKYGAMSPVEFVPLLEESGLIIPVGRFVYMTAIKQCKVWKQIRNDFMMHINLSYVQLKKSEIIDEITKYIKDEGLDTASIVLELTESGEIETQGKVRDTVDDIAKNGEGLAIDDFGTGYSNMRYLKELKVNTLKIDRAFVVNSTSLGFDYNLIKHFTDLAHSVDMKICLEGVETKEQLDVLKGLSPDYIQGFYFGRPETAEDFYDNFIRRD